MDKLPPAGTHLIIGLTGNIGSGKSSVRKMLEHLGALGVDADRIAKDALKKDSPAFPILRELFGKRIVDRAGEIDRKKLGKIVFQDPAKLKQLEEISHPLVSSACGKIIANSPLPIVVIEAIKLLESDLAPLCQSIWVVETAPDVVYERLKKSRGMSRSEVDARLAQQSPVSAKKEKADVVINNSASSRETWQQVKSAFSSIKRQSINADTGHHQEITPGLLLPVKDSIGKLKETLQRHPNSLLNQVICARMTGQVNPAQLKEWYKDDNLIFRCLIHYYFEQSENYNLACWELDHFSCAMAGYIHSDDIKDPGNIRVLLDHMERFGEAHLCHIFSIPINKEDASFIGEMGYEKQQKPALFDEVYTKAGYNLYTKIIPLPFDFF